MTSYDDILDALIAQGRVGKLRLSCADLQRKLTEPAGWLHTVGNFRRQLATMPEHGIFHGILSCAKNKLLN